MTVTKLIYPQPARQRESVSTSIDFKLLHQLPGRLVLANTEELHARIEHLCARIRDLEDALRALQGEVSDRPHPLLRTDLLHIKSLPSQNSPEGPSSSSSGSRNSSSTLASDEIPDPTQARTEEENFIDAFGTPFNLSAVSIRV